MNGQELAELQEESGVRGLVQDLDALRVKLGLDCVIVQTPRAEVTVRSGYQAKIPLVVLCRIPDEDVDIVIGFPMGYPEFEALEIQKCSCGDADEELAVELQEQLQEFSDQSIGEVQYAIDVITRAKEIIKEWRIIPENVTYESHITDPSPMMEVSAANDDRCDATEAEAKKMKAYSCRLCRSYLFCDKDLEPHEGYLNCSTLFISEPVMPASLDDGSIGGKIGCPHCGAKLGSWCWVGTQCSCKCATYVLSFSFVYVLIHATY